MTTRRRLKIAAAVALAVLVAAGAVVAVRNTFFRPKTITAYFETATAIYPGDDVRVSGIKVGTVKSIKPEGTKAKIVMHVDHDVPIPADARAVLVAQNLVAARYIQLAPAYRTSGPKMGDGAVIPQSRTAVPVEWDEIKDNLMKLATDLGPKPGAKDSEISTSVGRFIDSAAKALGDGNGDKLRQTLSQLSGVARVFADGSTNIVDIIKNLQAFITVLRDSSDQLVMFNNRLASLTSVLDDNKSDLDAAVTNLSTAVVEVQRFIAETRDQTSEQVARLADLTQILVDNKQSLRNILHVTPNALANAYSNYEPDMGVIRGGFSISNAANSTNFICSQMGALENVTATETGKLCGLYAGPALKVFNPFFLFNFNYLPIPVNPFLAPSATRENLVYTEKRLEPGGEGPKPGPPDLPPAVSAYTGVPGDVPPQAPPPPPPGRIPGAAMPEPPAPTRPEESAAPPAPPVPGFLPAEGQ